MFNGPMDQNLDETAVADRVLILRLQKGDLEALGLLFDRHRLMVYRTALGITGDPEAAADLLQEVFLRMHRFCRRIDAERPIQPWLYRATANLTYTWLKRQNRGQRYITELGVLLTRERRPTPQAIAERHEQWQIVQNALAALPPSQRVVVVLHYLNDLSLQELSEILEVPVGTVKSRLHYGRLGLRKLLGLTGESRSGIGYEYTA